jgi:FkbM family methyltransferase
MRPSKFRRLVRRCGLWLSLPLADQPAYLLCGLIYAGSGLWCRVTGRRHNAWPYYMMRAFRLLRHGREYIVDVENPVLSGQKIRLSLDLRRNMHVRYFFAQSIIDADGIQIIHSAMPTAECFLDVGSNSGAFALAIAQACPDRKVIACEPVPDNYRTILRNVALNDLRNVEVLNAAAGNAAGEATFYINPYHDGGGALIRPPAYQTMGLEFPVSDNPPSISVQTIPLDSLITSKSAVKIDVEGFEIDVLESMAGAMRSGRVDVFLVEVSAGNWHAVWSSSKALGFSAVALGTRAPADGTYRITDVSDDFIFTRDN